MMRKLGGVIASWMVMIGAVLCVWLYAQSIKPEMSAPEVVYVQTKGEDVFLQWNKVEYASLYSIHFRSCNADSWSLLKTVTTTSYLHEKAVADNLEYVVRACNQSLGKMYWSDFSHPAVADANQK